MFSFFFFCSGTREKLVVILDPVYKTTVRRIPGHTEEVCSVAFSPDGKYLASLSAGKELIIWLPEVKRLAVNNGFPASDGLKR